MKKKLLRGAMGPKNLKLKMYGVPDVGLRGGLWPGFVRIGLVEVGDKFGSVRELSCREPRGFLIRTFIIGPLNQVLELAFAPFVYLGIED